MSYQAKNFNHLLGAAGLSDVLLNNHFTLYQGYVTNVNKVNDVLSLLLKDGKTAGPEFAEIRRRLGWEFNGMRLHECYFENITKDGFGLNKNSPFYSQLVSDFDSFENWVKDFKSVGTMRGIGWVVLCYDSTGKKLFNVWINEHDGGHFAGATPLLVMDVFEHAYLTDYGLKRADYIETFFKLINWQAVTQRFNSPC